MNDPRELVSTASRVLGAAGEDDFIWGHVSLRDEGGRGVWMKRSGIGLSEVSPDDVLLVSPSGDVLEGVGRRHIEYPIHTEVMARRADVGAVAHLHSRHAVALAASGNALRPISHEATLFVPPEVPVYSDTTDLIRTPELGAGVADVLGGERAAMLLNHGVVVVHTDIRRVTVAALLLEEAAREQLRVDGFGGAAHWTDDDEAIEKRARIYSPQALLDVWEYLVRHVSIS